MLELWPIAREVISPSSFQIIKKKKTLFKKKTQNKMEQKKSSAVPPLFKLSCFSLLWFPKQDFTVSKKNLHNTNNSLISGMKH